MEKLERLVLHNNIQWYLEEIETEDEIKFVIDNPIILEDNEKFVIIHNKKSKYYNDLNKQISKHKFILESLLDIKRIYKN